MIPVPKFLMTLILSSWCLLAITQSELTRILNFGSNPGNLQMMMHKSNDLPQENEKRPLVVILHGCSQSADAVAIQTGWNKLADSYQFYAMYPQQKMSNNPNDCYNWFRPNDVSKNKGEAHSIKQMIDYVRDSLSIDSTRIFIYGLSAGAAMAVALMADYPALFNAGAILAGGPFMSAENYAQGMVAMTNPRQKSSFELAQPVIRQNPTFTQPYPRMIIIHGKKDFVVDIRNSYQLIQQWTFVHHTDTIADEKITSFNSNDDITKYIYRDSLNRDILIYYEAEDLGHAVMIDPGDSVYQGGQKSIFAVDKNFFSTYWIARDFGLITP